ncbi:MAG: non-canonical purine NTP pyrophosphatase [Hyphomicrobiales bacterium]|nr:non-canonical purine NTP pyrophosphatase [Hyphomicrobiales bacterium]
MIGAVPDAKAEGSRQWRPLSGRVVIATHNAGKLAEMDALLAPYGVMTSSAGALGLPEPAETGWMFAENAAIKAQAAATATGLPAVADDSGLCVDALDGAPGLFTADWAGQPRDFLAAMTRVVRELERRAVPQDRWQAHFVSALVIAWPDGHQELFEGRVHGACIWPPRGPGGFGYDPMFRPDGHVRTFGEMSADEKHGIPADGSQGLSHRARAFQLLAAACLTPCMRPEKAR